MTAAASARSLGVHFRMSRAPGTGRDSLWLSMVGARGCLTPAGITPTARIVHMRCARDVERLTERRGQR